MCHKACCFLHAFVVFVIKKGKDNIYLEFMEELWLKKFLKIYL